MTQDAAQEDHDDAIAERRAMLRQSLRFRRREALGAWMMLACASVAATIIYNRFDRDACLDVLARAAGHHASLLACLCRMGTPKWDGSWEARSAYGMTGGVDGWRGLIIPIVARQEGRGEVSYELGIGGFAPRCWWKRWFVLGWGRAHFDVFVREADSGAKIAKTKEQALDWLHTLPWPVDAIFDGSDTCD